MFGFSEKRKDDFDIESISDISEISSDNNGVNEKEKDSIENFKES